MDGYFIVLEPFLEQNNTSLSAAQMPFHTNFTLTEIYILDYNVYVLSRELIKGNLVKSFPTLFVRCLLCFPYGKIYRVEAKFKFMLLAGPTLIPCSYVS